MGLKSIALILPHTGNQSMPSWERQIVFASHTLDAVANSITTDAKVSFYDESIEPIDYGKEFDLVGISINTATAPHGYAIGSHFRKQGSVVVYGGIHATVRPSEALKYGSSVVIGEAEGAFQRLLDDYNHDHVERIYKNRKPFDLSGLRTPIRRRLSINALVIPAVESARGCVNSCISCWHPPYHTRPLDDVVADVASLGSEIFTFSDMNIGNGRPRLEELLTRITPLKKKWLTEMQSTYLEDEGMVQRLAEAGCIGLFVGYESVHRRTLSKMQKGFNEPDSYRKGVENAHKYGIVIQGAFMFGFDTDTTDSFECALTVANEMQLDLPLFSIVIPYPGTQFYHKVQDRLLYTKYPEDWAHYERTCATFLPKNMTTRELEEGVKRCWQEFFSPASIAYRFADNRQNSSWQMQQAYQWNLDAAKAFGTEHL